MYNPFINGNYPVGVRTIELTGIDSNYTTEIWYPAADEYRGQTALDTFKFVDELPEATQEAIRDAKAADGKRPLVMYWHGGYGHRREAAAMCVFLASHGLAVAAPDFPGDNVTHTFGSDPMIVKQPIENSVQARPVQGAEIIELLATSDDAFVSSIIDASKVGSFGMSMGGYTTLAVNSESTRMAASVAVCPMTGTRSMVPQVKRVSGFLRTDDWRSDVSTFVITGDQDCFVILEDVRELYSKIDDPKRLLVLKGAGHIHWADNAEFIHETMRSRYTSGEFPDPEIDGPNLAKAMRPFSELCPAAHATDTYRSVALAHFEAELKGSVEARAFLDDDLAGTFADRGIDLEVGVTKAPRVAAGT